MMVLAPHLHCEPHPAGHTAPATHVLPTSRPVSTDPRDGHDHTLIPVCAHPACWATAVRQLDAWDDIEPVRPIDLADLHELGYEQEMAA